MPVEWVGIGRVTHNHVCEQVFVIGGGKVFSATLGLADRLELTEIDSDLDGNVLFPAIVKSEWREVAREAGEENGIRFAFVTYERERR